MKVTPLIILTATTLTAGTASVGAQLQGVTLQGGQALQFTQVKCKARPSVFAACSSK